MAIFLRGFLWAFCLGYGFYAGLQSTISKNLLSFIKRINHLRSENNILQSRIDSLRREAESQKEKNYELKSALKNIQKAI